MVNNTILLSITAHWDNLGPIWPTFGPNLTSLSRVQVFSWLNSIFRTRRLHWYKCTKVGQELPTISDISSVDFVTLACNSWRHFVSPISVYNQRLGMSTLYTNHSELQVIHYGTESTIHICVHIYSNVFITSISDLYLLQVSRDLFSMVISYVLFYFI